MSSTKLRHQEIADQARVLLAGIDIAEAVPVRMLAKQLVVVTGCHYSTAKRHIARAARVERAAWLDVRGGIRVGAGRPPKEQGE